VIILIGCAINSHHPFIKPTNNHYSLNLLSDSNKNDLKKLARAKLGAAHGRNYIFANKSNIYLSKSQIRYAFRHADASSLGIAVPDLKMGSDRLVNFLTLETISTIAFGVGEMSTIKKLLPQMRPSKVIFFLTRSHGRNYIFANKSNIYLSKSQTRYAFRHADASSLGIAVPDLKMGSDRLVNFLNLQTISTIAFGVGEMSTIKNFCLRCVLPK
jgi:hypothetical protein